MSEWTFLTDHAHVLVLLARDPRASLAEVATEAEIPAQRVRRIVADLVASGHVEERSDHGRTVRVVDRTAQLRHAVEAHHPVGRLLHAVQTPADVLSERLLIGS
jgi:DNA-binding IclR family transcriptional regulator